MKDYVKQTNKLEDPEGLKTRIAHTQLGLGSLALAGTLYKAREKEAAKFIDQYDGKFEQQSWLSKLFNSRREI